MIGVFAATREFGAARRIWSAFGPHPGIAQASVRHPANIGRHQEGGRCRTHVRGDALVTLKRHPRTYGDFRGGRAKPGGGQGAIWGKPGGREAISQKGNLPGSRRPREPVGPQKTAPKPEWLQPGVWLPEVRCTAGYLAGIWWFWSPLGFWCRVCCGVCCHLGPIQACSLHSLRPAVRQQTPPQHWRAA